MEFHNCRWVVVFVILLALIGSVIQRTAINFAIVAMTDSDKGNNTESKKEFSWSSIQQGTVVGSFFYGYSLPSQILSGYMSDRFGGKWFLRLSLLGSSLATLAVPICARTNINLLFTTLASMGIAQGFTYPAIVAILARWIPLGDRGTAFAIIWSCDHLGNMILGPLSAFLSNSKVFGGWPSVFYVGGMMGVMLTLLTCMTISSGPEEAAVCIRVSLKEMEYISKEIGPRNFAHRRVPWCAILTNRIVIVLLITAICFQIQYSFMVNEMPMYYRNAFDIKITDIGTYTVLPFACSLIVNLLGGWIVDKIERHRLLSVTNNRKVVNAIAMTAPIWLIVATYTPLGKVYVVVICQCLFTAILDLSRFGVWLNTMDLSPCYSGMIMAFVNCLSMTSCFIEPLITGTFIRGHPTTDQYRKVFWLFCGLSVAAILLYSFFGSAEQQVWSSTEVNGHEENTENDDDQFLLIQSDGDIRLYTL